MHILGKYKNIYCGDGLVYIYIYMLTKSENDRRQMVSSDYALGDEKVYLMDTANGNLLDTKAQFILRRTVLYCRVVWMPVPVP